MCKSVPQTDATFTFTKTSVGPMVGMATSRMSAPGAASGFTTASIVLTIQGVTEEQVRGSKPLSLSRTEQQLRRLREPALRMLIFRLPSESLRLPFGNAERLPLRAAKVFCQEDNLADVVGIV